MSDKQAMFKSRQVVEGDRAILGVKESYRPARLHLGHQGIEARVCWSSPHFGSFGTALRRVLCVMTLIAVLFTPIADGFGLAARKNNKAKRTQLKGKGDYQTAMRVANKVAQNAPAIEKLVSAMNLGGGALAGAAARNAPKILSSLSHYHKKIKKLIGSGDYRMGDTPVRMNSLIKGSCPIDATFGGDPRAGLAVAHDEFACAMAADSATAGAFTRVDFDINPTSGYLSWLSRIGANYEEFKLLGVVVRLVSTYGSFSTTGGLGAWFVTSSTNPDNPAPGSKIAFENSNGAVSAKINENILYGVECAPGAFGREWYFCDRNSSTRANSVPVIVRVGAQPDAAIPAGSKLGEIWITYHIALKTPLYTPVRCPTAHYVGTSPTTANPLGTQTNLKVLGGFYGTTFSGTKITLGECVVGDVVSVSVVVSFGSQVAITYGGVYVAASTSMANFKYIATTGGETWACQTPPSGTTTAEYQCEGIFVVTNCFPPPQILLAPTLTAWGTSPTIDINVRKIMNYASDVNDPLTVPAARVIERQDGYVFPRDVNGDFIALDTEELTDDELLEILARRKNKRKE